MKLIRLIVLLLIAQGAFGQSKPVVYVADYDVLVKEYNRWGIKGKEIPFYSHDYRKRFQPILEKAFKEEDDVTFKFINKDKLTPEEKQDLIQVNEYIFKQYEEMNLNRVKYFKKDKQPKPDARYIELLNSLADKLNSDVLSFIYINGIVREKPDKQGNYDENAKGYLIYLGLVVDANNGRIMADYTNYYPKEPGINADPVFRVLKENNVQDYTEKFIHSFSNDYERAVKRDTRKKR